MVGLFWGGAGGFEWSTGGTDGFDWFGGGAGLYESDGCGVEIGGGGLFC